MPPEDNLANSQNWSQTGKKKHSAGNSNLVTLRSQPIPTWKTGVGLRSLEIPIVRIRCLGGHARNF